VKLRPARLGLAELLIAIGAVGLLVVLFAVTWYEVNPRFRDSLLALGETVSANGWNTFTWIGPLCLVVAVLGLLAVWLQVSRDSPTLPVVTVILLMPLSLLAILALLIRVLIDRPELQLVGGSMSTLVVRPGAYAGLLFAVVISAGCWLSLRRDGVASADSPAFIEVVPLEQSPPHSRA
jgi:hypothetical protein